MGDARGPPGGKYFLLVDGAAGATNPLYSLTINAPPCNWIRRRNKPSLRACNQWPRIAKADWAEPDNSKDTAKDLRLVNGTTQANNLSIDSDSDEDWFRFQIGTPSGHGHNINLQFNSAEGDLDLELYDDKGLVARSNGFGDSEQINLDDRPAGTYLRSCPRGRSKTQPQLLAHDRRARSTDGRLGREDIACIRWHSEH